jgi:hypothetical protein
MKTQIIDVEEQRVGYDKMIANAGKYLQPFPMFRGFLHIFPWLGTRTQLRLEHPYPILKLCLDGRGGVGLVNFVVVHILYTERSLFINNH